MQILEQIENYFDIVLRRPFLALILIISVGILLRVFFINWHIPPEAPDAFVFLIEGLSFSKGDFSYFSTRFLWSGLLSIIFMFFNFDNNLGYFNLMRIISILVSISSVPLIYFISKLFVDKKYAILASAIFAFEPNIIENSLFVITEPLFILCGLAGMYFLIQKNNKLIPLAFLFVGLAFDTRVNGVVLVLLVLIFCSLKIIKKEISVKLFILGCSVLILIIIPHIYLPLEQNNIPFLSYFTSSAKIISNNQVFSATYSSDSQDDFSVLKNSIIKELIHLGRISIPYLIIFVPIGIVSSLKNFDINKKILFSAIVISLIVAVPQYLISAEYRNLLFIIPIFCILSAIGIQRVCHNRSYKNLIVVFLLFVLISASFTFLKFHLDKDMTTIEEKEKFGRFVIDNFSGRILGVPYNEISHNIPNAKLGTVEEGNVYNNKIAILVTYVPIDSEEKLRTTISNLHVDYIITDNEKNNRYPIFQDIFKNETKYSYLEKVFDSRDHEYKKYEVKIFKVNSFFP